MMCQSRKSFFRQLGTLECRHAVWRKKEESLDLVIGRGERTWEEVWQELVNSPQYDLGTLFESYDRVAVSKSLIEVLRVKEGELCYLCVLEESDDGQYSERVIRVSFWARPLVFEDKLMFEDEIYWRRPVIQFFGKEGGMKVVLTPREAGGSAQARK